MIDEIGRPADMELRPITYETATAFAVEVYDETAGAVAAGTMSHEGRQFEKAYLGPFLRLYNFWGAEFYGVFSGAMVTLHVASFTKSPRKNAWGRYVTHYLAYTRPTARAFGFASHGEMDLQAEAFERGYDRLQTLCQSWLGVLYHGRLRDQIWGANDKGELVIDSPLHPGPWPDGVPIKARKWNTTGAETDDTTLHAILTAPDGRFRASPEQADRAIAKRAERRGHDSNVRGPEPYPVSNRAPSATQPPPRG